MPRHPPYTLSSLTTFIDHRHDPLPLPLVNGGRLRESRRACRRRYRRPITDLDRDGHWVNIRPVSRQKGARRHPVPTEKPRTPGGEARNPKLGTRRRERFYLIE